MTRPDGDPRINGQTPSPLPRGSELAALLHPISVHEFLEHYWGREALLVQGQKKPLHRVLSTEALQRAAQQPEGGVVKASFERGELQTEGEGHRAFAAAPDQVEPLHRAGATLYVTDLAGRLPRLAHLPLALQTQLSHSGLVALDGFLSADGTGFAPHFDASASLTLQIEGRKRWRFSTTPAMPFPSGNAYVRPDGGTAWKEGAEGAGEPPPYDDSQMQEVVLEPGDVLYLPPGAWHAAKAKGRSLSAAFRLLHNPMWNFFYEFMNRCFAQDPDWLAGLPAVHEHEWSSGRMPQRIEAFLEARRDELRQALGDLESNTALAHHLWRLAITGARPDHDAAGVTSRQDDADWRRADRLRVRGQLLFRIDQDPNSGDERLLVSHGERQLGLGLECLPVIQRLTRNGSVLAGELALVEEDLEWGEVRDFLATFEGLGIVERVEPAAELAS